VIVRGYLIGRVGRSGRGTRGTPNGALGVTSRLPLGWKARGPVEPDRYFSFVQTRTEPLPLTYVPATVRHGWLDSGLGCGQCARARRAQCRRLYHDPAIGPVRQ